MDMIWVREKSMTISVVRTMTTKNHMLYGESCIGNQNFCPFTFNEFMIRVACIKFFTHRSLSAVLQFRHLFASAAKQGPFENVVMLYIQWLQFVCKLLRK